VPHLLIIKQIAMANSNTPNNCNICWKPTRPQNRTIKCTICQILIHTNCLPFYQTADTSYAENPNNHWTCILCLQTLFPFPEDDNISAQTNNCTETLFHDIDQLNNLQYDQFGTEWDGEDGILEDIDPDANYTNPKNCLYYHSNGLNAESSKHVTKESLSIFHLNIQSLSKNFSNLTLCLDAIDTKFTAIILSETWLKDHNADIFQLDGYEHEHIVRSTTGGDR
jgi:hypothetical protein